MDITKNGTRHLLRWVFPHNIAKFRKNRSICLHNGPILNLLHAFEQPFQPCVWGVHSTDLVGYLLLTFTTTLHIIGVLRVKNRLISFRFGFFQLGIIRDVFSATVIFFVPLIIEDTGFVSSMIGGSRTPPSTTKEGTPSVPSPKRPLFGTSKLKFSTGLWTAARDGVFSVLTFRETGYPTSAILVDATLGSDSR